MNVALTRAKSSLYILGNAATLERSDPNWRRIVGDARGRSRLVEVCLSPAHDSKTEFGDLGRSYLLHQTNLYIEQQAWPQITEVNLRRNTSVFTRFIQA